MSIAAHPKINEWLTLVEKEMRVTLAKLLAAAVKDTYEFKAGSIDPNQYLVWVDKYQVRYYYMHKNLKLFLWSFVLFKKGSGQLLAKVCIQVLFNWSVTGKSLHTSTV